MFHFEKILTNCSLLWIPFIQGYHDKLARVKKFQKYNWKSWTDGIFSFAACLDDFGVRSLSNMGNYFLLYARRGSIC